MPKHVSRANAAKSGVRAHVEHVFARQKGPMALVIRTIGLARATVKIGLANLVHNMRRMAWLAAARARRPPRPAARRRAAFKRPKPPWRSGKRRLPST